MMRPLAALAALIAFVGVTTSARADLNIDVNRGKADPLPIAVTSFTGASAGTDIAQVVSADLERSGLFRPIDPRSFVQEPAAMRPAPRFADWRVINAPALVTGAVDPQGDGRLRVEFRLWDVFAARQLTGMAYFTTPQNWRRIAHIVADEIYKRITGEDGYFDTRVVYIAETGPQDRRVKRLAIMDQDGFNHHYLTDGRSLVLTPRFSPNMQEITYLSYARGLPRVYLFNIDTGRQEVLGTFPGMTFAPRFSPDGSQVIFSQSTNGESQIYTMHLRSHAVRQLTNSNAIDTSPSYAPDGTRITFNSDRSGTPQLFVMNADGSDQKRISFGSGRYMTPVWSPRGDLIAFTRQQGSQFSIGVMKPDGSGERLLTSGFLTEAPSWAPNGRVVMFFKQTPSDTHGRGGTTRLYSIDLTGANERPVTTPVEGSDPAWSPLLK